jgi:hypothetical protein
VKAEIDRLRSSHESDLIAQVDTPNQISFASRTGRQLLGEITIFWDRLAEPGSIGAIVEVREPKPGRARPIAQGSFIRSPDGTFTPPTYNPYGSLVVPGIPGGVFHDAEVTDLRLDPAGRTLRLDIELDRHWNPGVTGTLRLRFEDVTDYELTELNDEGFNIVMDLEVVVADDGRLDVELESCYPNLGVEGRFRCASIAEA